MHDSHISGTRSTFQKSRRNETRASHRSRPSRNGQRGGGALETLTCWLLLLLRRAHPCAEPVSPSRLPYTGSGDRQAGGDQQTPYFNVNKHPGGAILQLPHGRSLRGSVCARSRGLGPSTSPSMVWVWCTLLRFFSRGALADRERQRCWSAWSDLETGDGHNVFDPFGVAGECDSCVIRSPASVRYDRTGQQGSEGEASCIDQVACRCGRRGI